ncbi:hypothetical protein [Corynebacterium cystitidis]|uniref:Uncharacterized protein n=1 Tax=Corynebacterium cystitidis DSM 20524 TaxID=1121357 RepID=A0A1H9QZ63_9CORY|nr:hypothetical protein [Corynebacterium cystitidis]WJY81629.1 hypothetical protein CCYS_03310 [Corynebacterium cystitidis DSM 20524]SER65003.1 hypothetical protein SAMN05661109_00697 [Corynebacterium cystitidis DSM 20524]SNV85539.1 Uncharacterised protein [Corynebacterium cystitidis]
MKGTSVRKLEGLDRHETIAALRLRMADIGGDVPAHVVDDSDVVPVGENLQALLPHGGLPRRAVTHCSDTASLVVELVEQATSQGQHVGVVGWPDLSYAGVARCDRVIAVPDPGTDPLHIASVLVEGLDVVVYRTGVELNLSPVRARPLLGKLRAGQAALVMVGAKVPSPALSISAEVTQFRGIGKGSGRITGWDMRVRTEAKGYRPVSGVVTVGAQSRPGEHTQPSLRVVK